MNVSASKQHLYSICYIIYILCYSYFTLCLASSVSDEMFDLLSNVPKLRFGLPQKHRISLDKFKRLSSVWVAIKLGSLRFEATSDRPMLLIYIHYN